MTILITGGNGKLGKELRKVFPDALAPTHKEFDITNVKQVKRYLEQSNPDIIIHCAALTSINQCQEDQRLAYATNVLGTENLISVCADNCYFVYVSTACVFQGDRGNYAEDDLPSPKNYYGLTKLLGEFVACKTRTKSLIIRTNFTDRERWPYPKAFTDRFGTYLFAETVARGIRDVIKKSLTGVVHIVGDRRMSMYELAKITTPDIEPMTLDEYHGPPLTIDMSLNTIRWRRYEIQI